MEHERRTITLEVDADTLELLTEELAGAAGRRRVVAERAAGELERERREKAAAGERVDIRSGALRVVDQLAAADAFEGLRDALTEAWDAAGADPDPAGAGDAQLDLEPGDDDEEPEGPAGDPDVVAAREQLLREAEAVAAAGGAHAIG